MLTYAFTLVKRVFSSKYYYKTAKWELLAQIDQYKAHSGPFPAHFLHLTKYYKTFKNSRLIQYGDFIPQDGDFIQQGGEYAQEDPARCRQDPQEETIQEKLLSQNLDKVQR